MTDPILPAAEVEAMRARAEANKGIIASPWPTYDRRSIRLDPDEVIRWADSDAALRAKNAALRQRVGELEAGLSKIRSATDVPDHKRDDAEFLRASCSIANSFARALSPSQESPDGR